MKLSKTCKAAVIFFSLLFFYGCSSNPASEKTPETFSGRGKAEYFGERYEFEVIKEQTSKYIFTVNCPHALEGMTVKYSDGSTELCLDGIQNKLDFRESSSVFALVSQILDDSSLAGRMTFQSRSGDTDFFTGSISHGSYKIGFKNGLPVSFSLPPNFSAELFFN